MIIRVNENNYFYDSTTRDRLEGYDPFNDNLKFRFLFNGYSVHIPKDKIRVTKLGICFEFNGSTYIIDDNHQYVLKYAAYIINDRSGCFEDSKTGLKSRDQISKLLRESIQEKFPLSDTEISKIDNCSLNYYCNFRNTKTKGNIVFQTISNLVNTNKTRRNLSLPYLPYEKNIDRYNSYYMSIWCGDTNGSTFNVLLAELVEKLNHKDDTFSFFARSLPINNRLIRVRDDLL